MPHRGEIPSLTQRYTPPDQPDANSAATSDCGSRNTIAGTMYRNTHARPYTAIVGALRRLATDEVVINASVTQVMYFRLVVAAARGVATVCASVSMTPSTGTSIDDMTT